MTIADALATQVAKSLLPSEPSQLVGRRRGTVITVNAVTPPTVDVALGTTTIPGVRILAGADLAAGDAVFVDFTGPDPLVLGKTAPRETAWVDAGSAQGNTWRSIRGLDLYHPSSTPHIDFHAATGPAGDSNADYRWRLIMESANSMLLVMAGQTGFGPGFRWYSDGEFQCNHLGVGGDNVVNAGIYCYGGHVRVKANYSFYFEDWGGGWYMADTTWVRVTNDKAVYTGGEIRSGAASMRNAVYADHAAFGHYNYTGTNQRYGFLQRGSDGWLWISGGARTTFQTDDAERMFVDSNALYLNGTALSLRDHAIWTRDWNDGWHVMGWSSPIDGLRITEYGGIYVRVRDADPTFRILPEAITEHYRFDQLGGWDTMTIRGKAAGGGSPTGVAWWEAGRNAAHLIKSWFSALECRSWDNSGWGVFRGELEDYSSAQSKANIRSAVDRLPKADRRAKIKRLRTTHFNRRRGGCANCMGTGLARENRRILDDGDMPSIRFDDPCPDCGGLGRDFMHEHDRKTEEAGWFGFISEEVEREFPEAVYYRPSESDQAKIEVSGISVQALVAVLWEDNRDQQDEIADLQARLAKLEGKK